MIDYANMRRSLLASFGEPVTVVVGGLDRPFTAAFLGPYVGVDAGVQINRPDPQFVGSFADWEATGAQNGAIIVRANGSEYTVIDAKPGDDGMVTIEARRYRC